MASKQPSGPQSLPDALMDAAQAITRAMGTAEAANPTLQQSLSKLLAVTVQMARHPAGPAQQGAPPGQPGAPPPGGPPGGMAPPGGGAANPMMPSMGGPTPPGAGATMGIPQMNPDELRRMIGAST